MEEIDEETYEKLLRDASEHNLQLLSKSNPFVLSGSQAENYPSLLNISEDGIMGYIEIPVIGVSLPLLRLCLYE